MKIVNESLLDEFRNALRCEWCKKPAKCDPHHVFAKGMGGGGRLDVRVNLVALCRVCHTLTHAGEIARYDLLAIIAVREGMLQDKIEEEVWRLRRLKKGEVA